MDRLRQTPQVLRGQALASDNIMAMPTCETAAVARTEVFAMEVVDALGPSHARMESAERPQCQHTRTD